MRFFYLILGVFTLMSTPVQAQTASRQDVVDSMEECRTISVAFMRDACLTAADAFLASNDDLPETSTQVSLDDSTASELSELAAARAALEQERAALDETRAALEASENELAAGQRRGNLDKLGLAQSEQDDEQVAAGITIERITYNPQNIHSFHTSDGDVLVQYANSLRLRLPTSLPATARLERRLLGSKWLIFDEHPGRAYKVKVISGGR